MSRNDSPCAMHCTFRYWPVANASEQTSQSDLPSLIQTDKESPAESDDRQDNCEKTPHFRVVKCLTTPCNTEVSVSVRTTSVGLIYMVPHPSSVKYRLVQPLSGLSIHCRKCQFQYQYKSQTFRRNQQHCLNKYYSVSEPTNWNSLYHSTKLQSFHLGGDGVGYICGRHLPRCTVQRK